MVGANDKVRQKYEDYYERINLRDKMGSIFLQYYKYGQAYVYLMEDGNIITLPVHKCRISNMAVNGEPLVEFNVTSIRDEFQQSGIKAQKGFLDDDDLKNRLKGFPKEVIKALNDGAEYAQMDPNNCFVLQDFKEDWQRYAVPMIASFLPGLAKKALIGQYENALLNLGLRSFIHVTYGDPDNNMDLMPDATQLAQVRRIFSKAMSGSPLAVTNNWCKAETIQTDTRSLFEWDKYKEVNTELLSAGGISGIIVSGVSQEGSTFASAQVSIQTAVTRIKQAQKNFCEMMDKINLRLNGVEGGVSRSARSKIPRFTFMPLDLTGSKALQETCMKLWQQGVVSTQTLLDTHGYDMEQEYGRKKDEDAKGVTDVLSRSPEKPNEPAEPETDGEDGRGRPEMTDEERHSDPGNAERGKQPKPSNPEGSL